ncbi:indolepyruvate oxidoreductase subunit beta [Heliorestis convoluta]|uniref:Pyruvate ferredoxin oxidoreductase n=1 Tax=Heliorestis convoluta TaxID=356322 RepID=A0A5Q2NAF4_9FIRM|nr:indolepyruvate oxidoreductase subunit beta [Heliorestis convoluta]QGG49435.1 pyruvate ferredoxin oxidoreductase [Heliorestis convoluta]
MNCFDLIISGVGGQGTVLASRLFAEAALKVGLEVRTSETIGMAQREGPVISHVRVGQNLSGALIPNGKAQILLSLEPAEALRNWDKLAPDGIALVNSRPIIPPGLSSNEKGYNVPSILNFLAQEKDRVSLLDATEIALEAGNVKAVNMVMLGALSTVDILPFPGESLWSVAEEVLPSHLLEVNRLAFQAGRTAFEKSVEII